jgi:hypothetical protein
MVADGMLTRKRYREVPPRVDYELTERARDLMPVLAELARWGYQWAWSEPRQNERVDVGAILRLIPGLVEPGDAAGQLELNVVGGGRDGETVSYTVSLSGGRATVTERGVEQADARISGDVDAWIKAFAPTPDRRGLQVDGNADLAELLLTGLASSAAATPEDGTAAAGTAAAGTAAAGTAAAGTAA